MNSHSNPQCQTSTEPLQKPTYINLTQYFGNHLAGIQTIGAGGFADIYKVKFFNNEQTFAIKISLLDSEEKVKFASNEIRILSGFNGNINIPLYYNAYHFNSYTAIMMECFNYGDLLQLINAYIQKQINFTLDDYVCLMLGISKAVDALHKNLFVHCDIKPENILLRTIAPLTPVLCDFGFTKHQSDTDFKSKFFGTHFYQPPEAFKRGSFNTPKTDIFAMGITFWQIVAKNSPFNVDPQERNINEYAKKLCSGRREQIPLTCPQEINSLIQETWRKDPAQRPSANECVSRFQALK